MKIKAVLFAVALLGAMMALPISPARAMPRLDPRVGQTETMSPVEKTWYRYYHRPYYHRYYYRPHYYHRYYYRPHYYHRYYRWHRRYW